MRHFDFLAGSERDRLFHREPAAFDRSSPLPVLAMALGATLYVPADRPRLADDLARRAAAGVTSVVVCLEDAIRHEDVEAARGNVVRQLRAHAEQHRDGPLIFVRVRYPDQIPQIVTGLAEHLPVLSGFVLPKFTEQTGLPFLEALADAEASTEGVTDGPLLAMPVVESPEVIHYETRVEALYGIQRLVTKYRERILAMRVGATDFASAYALRRNPDLTVYDVRVVADVITHVVNVFARANETGLLVSGPVWEHFPDTERLFKPLLRESPFIEHEERVLRARLIAADLDGLIREVALDKANGLTGKTVIHPSHVPAVHALYVVSHEEYCDAMDIVHGAAASGGAHASAYRNKMNEGSPHRPWAERTLARADIFGVAREGVSFVDLLAASVR